MSENGPPERVRTLGVSHGFLETLGVAPALGRTILSADDQPGAPSVILLSDGFWRRRFAADAGIVGSDIRLNGDSVTVIGVLPAGFEAVGDAYLSVLVGRTKHSTPSVQRGSTMRVSDRRAT